VLVVMVAVSTPAEAGAQEEATVLAPPAAATEPEIPVEKPAAREELDVAPVSPHAKDAGKARQWFTSAFGGIQGVQCAHLAAPVVLLTAETLLALVAGGCTVLAAAAAVLGLLACLGGAGGGGYVALLALFGVAYVLGSVLSTIAGAWAWAVLVTTGLFALFSVVGGLVDVVASMVVPTLLWSRLSKPTRRALPRTPFLLKTVGAGLGVIALGWGAGLAMVGVAVALQVAAVVIYWAVMTALGSGTRRTPASTGAAVFYFGSLLASAGALLLAVPMPFVGSVAARITETEVGTRQVTALVEPDDAEDGDEENSPR
jgi:hypothetical protein